MKPILVAGLLTLLSAVHTSLYAEARTISETELVRRTQQMFDAVAPGNRAPWTLYLADDVLFFDEKGRSMDKRAVLADLEPMPKGYTGSIKVTQPNARFAEGMAILSYDAEEVETIFSQELHARYHTTDTWVFRNSLWQILASQTLRYYEDPARGKVGQALLHDYVGTYELAKGNTLVVTLRGDKLYAIHGASQPIELMPEVPDLFFRTGVEGRRLFHRDAAGRVDLLIDRRNNEDIIYKKIE
jgi:Domain of unknown function (DUF4440)/Domain of unknown function (DUF3471)